MALAHLTINLDAFTGDDHPPVPSYSTITLDPGADHIDAANDVIHVRTIVVSLDRQGKAATANGVPCVDGKVPVVAGVAYAASAPNVLRGGPHYIPALTAGQVVDLSDYITPGAPLTPDQAATLTARIVALEEAPPGGGATGVESVSGTVVLDGTGAPVREFWTTGAAAIGGVSFSADTAVVFRRTAAGSWGYKVVDGWTAVPLPDTTSPTAGTLSSSAITDTGFTLTVSGATDETALHSQPYAFSTDNGTTWSGWQTSSSLAVTGKTASTAYQCRHKVRDAALNETTGTAITVTTSAPVGTLTYQGYQSATADVFGDYTYAAPIGAADTDREVIVALSWRAGAGRDPSLTINGTAATLDYSTLTGNIGTKFYRASVPAGTTATIVSTSAASYWPTIAVWTTDAHVTFAAGGATTVNSGATSATVGPITAASPGFAIAAFRSNSAATAVAWTGATERYDLGTAQPASGADTLTTGPVTLSAAFTPAITNDVKLAVSTYGWA